MKKMNIEEAATYFNISKEAIHNRIRRGSLECVIEDGVKYVLFDENKPATQKRPTGVRKVQNEVDKYYQLIDEHNKKLEEKVQKLESEVSSLRDQKEQMLLAEMQKIEDIYIQKDEQLKNIITAISNKFISNPTPSIKDDEELDAEVEVLELHEEIEAKPKKKKSNLLSLKKFLKDKKLSKKEQDKIKQKFIKKAKKDERIIIIDAKYYVDDAKYDYSDFF